MKIVVINGTEVHGCTYEMKEMFLKAMDKDNEIVEYFLPKDCPEFCNGCKACFFSNISVCPHANYTVPIWSSISSCDLIVFTSPTYAFHVTAQLKALLDHYCTKWMSHSPENQMFGKQAVILTNAIGIGTKNVIKDIKDSLDYWGIARTYSIQQALFDTNWNIVTEKRKKNIWKQCMKASEKVKKNGNEVNPRVKIRMMFFIMKFAQKMINKSQIKAGNDSTKDYKYWKENGWLDGKKPW
ncbi:flavodoxin family protein [Clostridium estertheticum]|uniref:flavodoxin family protein n=1 Tax=Clostridium estertheticum TaxID=238834 RepID=UPI001C0DB2EB|nr:flavodoxin family protein [Clostridium estertheticum]MBU3073859.1 flavodoxin family protein [Clostridium estertheticum]MBU3163954.1 flavodoxin family protein [Clostridium estertheticum]